MIILPEFRKTELDTPVAPQLVRNAQLLTLYLRVDHRRVARLVPPSLAIHPSGRLVVNMWTQEHANQSTGFDGFGPMSVTYFAIEVTGPEGGTADGALTFPGRLWLHHWCSSQLARDYARQASGLEVDAGNTSVRTQPGRVEAVLALDGLDCVRASATTGSAIQETTSGHSLYYAGRARGAATEIAVYQVPWVADAFEVSAADLAIDFASGHPAHQIFGDDPPEIIAATYRHITLVPYLSQGAAALKGACP